MRREVVADVVDWEAALRLERARRVRLCDRFTGDVDAAEDLAQETLFEAWRHVHKLHDPAGRAQWLSAIARNVCLRWARRRSQEVARFAPLDAEVDPVTPRLEEELANDIDLERDLEREELITLLDRALALLPPATRTVLIAKYVHESPLAEVAARVGASEGAVAVTLHRGKAALRRLLSTDLCEQETRYGVTLPGSSGWQETRTWCPSCGQHRLLGWFAPGRTAFNRGTGIPSWPCARCAMFASGVPSATPRSSTRSRDWRFTCRRDSGSGGCTAGSMLSPSARWKLRDAPWSRRALKA